ncbi:MAG: hypothetical protein FJX29_00100 [Alphaproteobacteria bacterium]|nr:hypothetical protein [Alphaproteobacteria bacterium]
MFRLLGILVLTLCGALAGALLGLLAGAAAVESGKTVCAAAQCADAIIKTYAPLGAMLGAFAGFGKALSLRSSQF